ncbi:MAG TPA: ABC transporter permease subunit, partial [Chloroflexota bacterium]
MTVAAEGIVHRTSARGWRRPWSAATIALTLLVVLVCLLTMTPIGVTIVMAFRSAPPGQPATWGVNGFARAFTDPQVGSVVWTSLWLSVVRAFLATALAIVIAWIIARTDCPGRDKLFALITLSFFFPVIAKVLGWAVLGSPRTGYINQFLRLFPFFTENSGPIDIFSYGGLIFVSVLGWSTFLIIFLIPAFKAMDASLEESARMAGATARETLFKIMVPLMRPAIVAVLILALVRMFSSFEVEYFLGSKVGIYVFTNKIYERL